MKIIDWNTIRLHNEKHFPEKLNGNVYVCVSRKLRHRMRNDKRNRLHKFSFVELLRRMSTLIWLLGLENGNGDDKKKRTPQ